MAAPKAPVLGGDTAAKDVSLEEAVFAVDVKPHLVHETVRAEQNAARAGTRGAKSRGLVAGGRPKPWRQKGRGRAPPGTNRAPHWGRGGDKRGGLRGGARARRWRQRGRGRPRQGTNRAPHFAGGGVAFPP